MSETAADMKEQYDSPWDALAEEREARKELEEGWERYQILREVVASSTNMDEDELDQLVEQRRTEDGE